MKLSLRVALLLLPAFSLPACAVMQQSVPTSTLGTPVATTAPAPQATAAAAAFTDLSAYVDAGALAKLSGKSKAEASSAQFNALQFGRVGAPRSWTGDSGATGQVTVGPFIRVNLVECRDFTHAVTIGGVTFSKKGTACREADGSWTVSGAKSG
jgi:surface antigen